MDYPALLGYAALNAHRIVNQSTVDDGQVDFIRRACVDLVRNVEPTGYRPDGAAAAFIDHAHDWYQARVATGQRLTLPRGLWERLMVESPMGDYAAEIVPHLDLGPRLRVLEVGAGVGNATRLIRDAVGDRYVRADLHPRLCAAVDAPGSVAAWNFDDPPTEAVAGGGPYDVIFAVNALHCARAPGATVDRLAHLLAARGRLVVAEGAPWTRSGPWALTAAFGVMDGWWDRGGFRMAAYWRGLLSRHGATTAVPVVTDSGDEVGAVVACRAS